jgi:hypothetical protein
MVQVSGKHGTIIYEVVTQDEDTKRILDQVLANTLQSLVNEDTNRLKQKLSIATVPQKQQPHATTPGTPAEKYAKENVDVPDLLPLGGKWAYAVSIITDLSGEKEVRIAKGTIIGGFYRDRQTHEMVLKPDDPMRPIKQQNKINIKRVSDWTRLQAPVIKRLQALEST